jgi:arylsulfatase
VANAGLRYTQFHSTALCSPTRAALITGRNHHEVGFGVIAELSTGYPGYDAYIGPENATVGRILKGNGYATSWFGKNHNTPGSQYAGPYDQWPSGMGFEYFYGFMGGETDQWTPYLFRDHTQIYPWIGKPDYNLTTDLADEAIQHMKSLNATAPEQPFFVYYVPGGSHSPHQPTKEWIDKFKGKFDMGWNAMREQIFANQKRLGVIPAERRFQPTRKNCSRGRRKFSAPTLLIPITKSAASFKPSRTWASSKTRLSFISAATTAPVPKARWSARRTNTRLTMGFSTFRLKSN